MDKFEIICKKRINTLFFVGIILSILIPAQGDFPTSNYSFPPINISVQLFCPDSITLSIEAFEQTSAFEYPSGFSISPITSDIFSRIYGHSYPQDCPVPLNSLRYLTVLHTGFDGLTHQGELIVNEQIAGLILGIFCRLYEAGYPIEKISLIDNYSADDQASMTDNNTSAFCYRSIAGTDTLSLHSYGLAIDINPLYNPYIYGNTISPAASPYDREAGTVSSPYFMTEADYCVQLFLSLGFTWGGSWDTPKDYQHFEYRIEAIS